MRKAITLLLCLAMLALCGCSQNVSGEVTPADDPAQDVSGEVAPAKEPEPQPSEEPAETPVPAEEEPEASLQLGSYAGGVYENQFLGIGCELDENWSYADQDGLAQLMGFAADSFNNEELAEQFLSADMFYDMYAQADDGLVTINIMIQNMGILYGSIMDEAAYRDMSIVDFEEQMAASDFKDIQIEPNTLDFAGAERIGLHFSSTYQDIPYYCQLVFIKQGSYMACITLASFVEDICSDFADYFYAI